jgi:hypothetical protein
VKFTRSAAAVIVLLLVTVTALTFLYGVPSGRRARREALRVFRLAGNATGLHPLPVLTLRMWGGDLKSVLLVEVYESGRVVVSGRGDRIERHLTREAAESIIETGKAALGDFSAAGCGTQRGGLSSELYVLIDGKRIGSICRDASKWPRGSETRRLLADIERYLPGTIGAF